MLSFAKPDHPKRPANHPLAQLSVRKIVTPLLGVAIRERQVGAETEVASRFYIASRALSAQAFAQAVRGHWGIENQWHRQLDVTFREDGSRRHEGHAPQNCSLLRRIALSLLKQESTCKNGIAIKRQKAGWDHKYLERVLTSPVL